MGYVAAVGGMGNNPLSQPSPLTGRGLYDPFLDQPARQFRDAFDLVGDGAELLVEGDPRQPLGVLGERLLAVLLPEKARVAEPGCQHLAVAVDDRRAAVARGDVGGADEGIGELAASVAADEVFLVGTGG